MKVWIGEGLRIVSSDDTRVLALSGDLDIGAVAELGDEVLDYLSTRPVGAGQTLLLDLTGIAFADSTGLNLLVRARRRVMADGVTLSLRVAEHSRMARMLDLTGLDRAFCVHSVPDAESSADDEFAQDDQFTQDAHTA